MGMGLGLGLRLGNVAASGGGSPVLSSRKVALFVGDSTTVGVGAGSGGSGNVNGSRPFSFPLVASAWLTANGVKSIAETIAADNNNGITTTTWPGYRTDIAIAANEINASSAFTAGGTQMRLSGTAHTPIVWSPPSAVDTLEFWQPRVSGGGSLTISVDGGTATSFSVNNTTFDVQKLSLTGFGKGVHTFTFDGATVAAGAYFPIVNAYDSTTPSVQVINAGSRNWTTTDWAASSNVSANNPKTSLTNIAADIAIFNLGINDYRQAGTTIATFKTNMQALIDAAKLGNAAVKIILVVPTPIQTYNTTTDAWSPAAVLQAYLDLQAANAGSVLIDTPLAIFQAGLGSLNPGSTVGTRVNTYTNLSGLGLYPNADGLHPGTAIYAAEGNAVGSAIKTALGL